MRKQYSDFEEWELEKIDFFTYLISSVLKEGIKKKYILTDFVKNFITSDIFKRYPTDMTLYSQAPKYVLAKFEKEMIAKNIQTPTSLGMDPLDAEKAEWIGEMFVWWQQTDDEFPYSKLKDIDYKWLCDGVGILSMQDYDNAINDILHHLERQKEKNIPIDEREYEP